MELNERQIREQTAHLIGLVVDRRAAQAHRALAEALASAIRQAVEKARADGKENLT